MARKNSENAIEPPSKWKCPHCSNTVTVNVTMQQVPRCQNAVHRGSAYDMVRKD